MANANSTTSVRKSTEGLKVEEYWWGKYYRGSDAAFVAAGLIKPEWFPGLPGNAKCSVRVGMIEGQMRMLPRLAIPTNEQRYNGLISITKVGKRRFEVRIHFSKEEMERRSEEEQRQARMKEIERLHSAKQRALEDAPKSPQDFRESRANLIKTCLEGVLNLFQRHDNGYHYSREVIEEARDLIYDLYALAKDGKVYFDPKRQQYFLDDLEEKAEKAHPEFSAFMKATLAVGKAAL